MEWFFLGDVENLRLHKENKREKNVSSATAALGERRTKPKPRGLSKPLFAHPHPLLFPPPAAHCHPQFPRIAPGRGKGTAASIFMESCDKKLSSFRLSQSI